MLIIVCRQTFEVLQLKRLFCLAEIIRNSNTYLLLFYRTHYVTYEMRFLVCLISAHSVILRIFERILK